MTHTQAFSSKFTASEEKMTDSTVQKKSQLFWGEAETDAKLDILREMDHEVFGKLENKYSKGNAKQHVQLLCRCQLPVSGQILRKCWTYDVGWACVS